MSLLTKRSVLAAKLEATPGTEESVLTADTDYNVFDLDMQPEIEFTERQGSNAFGQLAGVLHARRGTCRFRIELTAGSGTTPPQWALAFLGACGMGYSSGLFTPKSLAPTGSGDATKPQTITLAHYQDGVKKVLYGAVGTYVFTGQAGRVISLEFTFTGKWKAVADVALLAKTAVAATDIPLRFASSAFSVGSYSYKINQFTLDAGNEVTLREDAGDATGFSSGIITGRRPVGTFDPEMVTVATKDVWGIWLARTEAALSVTGTDGTNKVVIAAPKLQFTNVQQGDRNGLAIWNADYQLNKSLPAGDDEYTISFEAV